VTSPILIAAVTLALSSHVALRPGPEAHARSSRSSAALAERAHTVCRDRVSLRHAPGGVTIGYLYRGDRVIVTLYARRHRWAYGIGADGYGWLLTRALCRRSQT
jgi:hypothetical protein